MSKFGWRRGNPSTFIPVGDVGEATKWLPYARVQLEVMMNNLVAAPTDLQPYRRRTYRPADGVIITLESLHGIPRITIEAGGYDYITITDTGEIFAGKFGIGNLCTSILPFPAFGPDGASRIGKNLMSIGGNRFVTSSTGSYFDRIAIVTVTGLSASLTYLPMWRQTDPDWYRAITILKYGGKSVDGEKRIEYLSAYVLDIAKPIYPYDVEVHPTSSAATRIISFLYMSAFSSTTPLGTSVSVDSGDLIEEALINPPQREPVFWIADNTYGVIYLHPTIPQTYGSPQTATILPGTPAPNAAYYEQWNWRKDLTLDITATVETDTYEGKTLYTVVFNLEFIEVTRLLQWDGMQGTNLGMDPFYIPGAESAEIIPMGALDALLPGVTFTRPDGWSPWALADTAGKYLQGDRHLVRTYAEITSSTMTHLSQGRIAVLILTERWGDAANYINGGSWGNWQEDNTPLAYGKSYLFNMVTIVSDDYGQSWSAKITRRTIGVSPFPDRLKSLDTLLYIGGDTVLAFGEMYLGYTVWRSTDAGRSYSMLVPPGGIPAIPVTDMTICLAPGVVGFLYYGQFYRSIDSGASWTAYQVSPDLAATSTNKSYARRIEVRAVGEALEGVEAYEVMKLAIIVETGYPTRFSRIFLSDDGGATWREDATIRLEKTVPWYGTAINVGALNTGLPPTPGLPGIYDIQPPE